VISATSLDVRRLSRPASSQLLLDAGAHRQPIPSWPRGRAMPRIVPLVAPFPFSASYRPACSDPARLYDAASVTRALAPLSPRHAAAPSTSYRRSSVVHPHHQPTSTSCTVMTAASRTATHIRDLLYEVLQPAARARLTISISSSRLIVAISLVTDTPAERNERAFSADRRPDPRRPHAKSNKPPRASHIAASAFLLIVLVPLWDRSMSFKTYDSNHSRREPQPARRVAGQAARSRDH